MNKEKLILDRELNTEKSIAILHEAIKHLFTYLLRKKRALEKMSFF